MSNTTLGLDLGPTSIGWALIDEAGKSVIAAGARVFPEGVDRDKQGGEKSKSQTRRDARGMRRQTHRRAQRKQHLRKVLIGAGLLPADAAQLNATLAANPYELRRRALDKRLDPYQIGRVLLHLNQHRGFLSNRRTDRAKAKETKGLLAEIDELGQTIEQTNSRTLGEYLASLDERFDHTTAGQNDGVRRRHTRRDMYEREFEAIWEAQRRHHPNLLTDELKITLDNPESDENWIHKGLIFGQRRVYWPKSVVGRCDLEPKEKRCPRADRAAQRFRILQEVNNFRLIDRFTREERVLTAEERAALVEYLSEARQRTFEQIRKKLRLGEGVRFNLEGPERKKLDGHVTDATLSGNNVLGKKRWKELSDELRDTIVAVLLDEEDEGEALRRLMDDCGLSPDEAERAMTVNLPEGRSNYSRKAIDKLLPHLERGLILMGEDASNSALHAAGYLRPDECSVGQRRFLPQTPDLPNPIVRQALVEVRRVVNAIIRQYGRPDRINVELAREAKQSFEQRMETRFELAKRRKQREDAKARIEEYDATIKPTRRTINRYLLWKEQEEFCVYCGRKIGIAQLFGGDVDVDHILPRWRSLDDSMANKVVCHRSCNDDKKQRTPREWLEDSEPERYETVLRIAERLPYNKQRKFQQKDVVLDDFVDRQLRDTAYISRCVTQYLQCLGARIDCTRGQMTADLRHWWGLNTILDPEGRGVKNRADHRHHAVDASVIALTSKKRLHALANARGKDMPLPWSDFPRDIERAIAKVNVSHRVGRRLSGAFHEATIYGATQKRSDRTLPLSPDERPWAKDWVEDEHTYVRRKPITDLTDTKHLAKVRDPRIREILREHLRERGIDCDEPGKIPGDALKGANAPRMPSGVPIKRLRMLKQSKTFRRVSDRRSYQCVNPGNNHHIVYRAVGDDKTEKWTAEVVTMWDAALRARNGRPIVDRSDSDKGRFVMSLSIGEMFRIDGEEGEHLLCVVRQTDQRSKRIDYKLHTDARQDTELKRDNLYLSPSRMQKRNAHKVTVDPLGRVRRAND